MDTTENKTEQYTVIEKKGKDLKYGDLVCIGGSQWESFDKDFEKSMKEINDDEHVFLVRLPSSPPMEVKDAEEVEEKIISIQETLQNVFDNKYVTDEFKRHAISEAIDKCVELQESVPNSQLQPPVISAEDFLHEKGLMLQGVKDYEARYRKQGVNDKGQRTSTFPELDLADLLTEYLQRQGQKTNQNKL